MMETRIIWHYRLGKLSESQASKYLELPVAEFRDLLAEYLEEGMNLYIEWMALMESIT